MKKLVVLGLVLAVSACSNVPKNPYDRAVYFKDKRAAELAEQAIENAPEWMTNLPIAENAGNIPTRLQEYEMCLYQYKNQAVRNAQN